MANDKKFIVKSGIITPNIEFANGAGTVTGNTLFSNSVTITGNTFFRGGVVANGSLGANGLVLTSNGTSVFWGSITAPSSVANATFSTTANNSLFVYGKQESQLSVSTANNSSFLAGRIWETAGSIGSTVANTGTFTLLTTSANTTFTGNTFFRGGVVANGSLGANGLVLTSNGTSVFWGSITAQASVANAVFADTANNALRFNGKQESQLSVSTANNSSFLAGRIWETAGAIGSTVANTGAFTTLIASSPATFNSNAVFNSGVVANGSLGTSGFVLVSNGTSAYWSNAAGISGTASTANNATFAYGKQESQLSVATSANAVFATTANNSLFAYGKQESQLSVASAVSVSGTVANATFATTANNALRFNGKQESQLSVANAVFADTANNALRFNGKQESQLSVATANNATYAYGKQESQLSVANAVFADTASTVLGISFITLDAGYTLANTTAYQKMFNSSTNGALTLPTGFYIFELMMYVTSMSTTSGNLGFDLKGAGTAILGDGLFHTIGVDSNNPINVQTQNGIFSNSLAAQTPINIATTGTVLASEIRGTFKVATEGTIIPSIALVTAISTAAVFAGSYFLVRRVAPTSTLTVGNWS